MKWQDSYIGPLTSILLFSNYESSVVMTTKQHQGNWCISTDIYFFVLVKTINVASSNKRTSPFDCDAPHLNLSPAQLCNCASVCVIKPTATIFSEDPWPSSTDESIHVAKCCSHYDMQAHICRKETQLMDSMFFWWKRRKGKKELEVFLSKKSDEGKEWERNRSPITLQILTQHSHSDLTFRS